jgi:hypothetical protein
VLTWMQSCCICSAFAVHLLGRGLAFVRYFGRPGKLYEDALTGPILSHLQGVKKWLHSWPHARPMPIANPRHPLQIGHSNFPVMLPSMRDQKHSTRQPPARLGGGNWPKKSPKNIGMN